MNARLLISASRAHLTDLTVMAQVGQSGGHSCAAGPAAGGGCSRVTRFHGGGGVRGQAAPRRTLHGRRQWTGGGCLEWPVAWHLWLGPWTLAQSQLLPAAGQRGSGGPSAGQPACALQISSFAPTDRRTPFTPSVPHPAPISFTNRADANQSPCSDCPIEVCSALGGAWRQGGSG